MGVEQTLTASVGEASPEPGRATGALASDGGD